MKLLASLIFFTRLPFWKIADVPPVYFKRVVDYWPFVGWLTGGIMAGTLWITAEFLPVQIAVLMALAARLLVTGALHEDGLADFCDGFGGGTSRDKILSIIRSARIIILLWIDVEYTHHTFCTLGMCGHIKRRCLEQVLCRTNHQHASIRP